MVMLAMMALLAEAPAPVILTPAPSDAILHNPYMGVYLQYPPLDAQPDEWFMELAGIAYYRLDWAEVNPEPGVYRFDEVFGPWFEFWVNRHGKRLALRVMCQNMHSRREYVTPKWVFDAGVPGVEHVGLYVPRQVDPAFWDEQYLDLQAEFTAKLGAWLDGRPGLEFVDIGSIGEWGEMHLARWTQADFDATGYTDAGYQAAYRRMIDAHAAAFPRTPVFLNVGGPDRLSLNDYAALRGMHFRQDGLKHDGASYNVERWLFPDYARRGTLCNFEFHATWEGNRQNGWDVPAAIERGLSAPICYLNSNLFGGGGYRQAPPEARELLLGAARRLGYRFVVSEVELTGPGRVSADRPGRLVFTARWRNDGVAWSHGSYAEIWALARPDGTEVCRTLDYPPTPTTRWDPGAVVETTHRLSPPPGTPAGDYRLLAGLIEPETGRLIQLGLAGRGESGLYDLGEVTLEAATGVGGVVFSADFEEGDAAGWNAARGLTATVVDGGREGGRALRLTGTCADTWNYLSRRVPTPLIPGARYRLTAWLRVDTASITREPYLKLGANRADGGWIGNFNTDPYNLQQRATWQRLTRVFELPITSAVGDIALERGALEPPLTIDCLLDDVTLELLDAG